MAIYEDLVSKARLKVFLDEIKKHFPVSVNGKKPDSKGNIVIPNFGGASASSNGVSGVVPAPLKGQQDKFLKSNGEWDIVSIAGGGTGATTAANARANLGLGNVAVENILPITKGGTGAANAADALTNLGVDITIFNLTGTIIAFAGNTLPKGYLLCDGSKVSRTTYKKLFDVIGTTYGNGDGSTTFNLPNAQNGRLFTNSTPSIAKDGDFTFNGTGVNTSDGTFHGSSYGASYTLTNSAIFNLNVGSTKNGYSTFGVGVLPNIKQNTSGGSWGEAPKPFQYKSGLKITMPAYAAVKFIIKY